MNPDYMNLAPFQVRYLKFKGQLHYEVYDLLIHYVLRPPYNESTTNKLPLSLAKQSTLISICLECFMFEALSFRYNYTYQDLNIQRNIIFNKKKTLLVYLYIYIPHFFHYEFVLIIYVHLIIIIINEQEPFIN